MYRIRKISITTCSSFESNNTIPIEIYNNGILKNSFGNPRTCFLEQFQQGGNCLELGVAKGEHALEMFNVLEPKSLFLVDKKENNSKHLTYLKEQDNVFFYKKWSLEAVNEFDDGYFDLIYIDADHNFDSVVNDINSWLPKVKKGGVISGHDFKMGLKGGFSYLDTGLLTQGDFNNVSKAVLQCLDDFYDIDDSIQLNLCWEGELYKYDKNMDKIIPRRKKGFEYYFIKGW
jgi:hypothetical protein